MTPDDEAVRPQAQRFSLLVMSAACGVTVGNIYICQPLLDEMTRAFGVGERAAGMVAVAAQVGYALGILLVVPLADVAEPRRLVRVLLAVTTLGLLGAAVAPGLPALVLATLVIAAATVVPQAIIPLAASLATPRRRGRVIGALQTGLILGILLSRTVSGVAAHYAGTWRASYLLAAVLSGVFVLLLPPFMPVVAGRRGTGSYLALLRSLLPLLGHGKLLVSMALGFCVFGAFSAFWATLAFHLASPAFGLGPAATGFFGLWGVAGAMLAPMGGRLSDRWGSNWVNAGALLCAALAFAFAGVLGATSLLALVLATNLLDFGLQSGQIANQTRIFSIGPDMGARLNTVYMVAVFGGGAAGSLLGTLAWTSAGWPGVCLVAAALIAAGALILGVSALATSAAKPTACADGPPPG